VSLVTRARLSAHLLDSACDAVAVPLPHAIERPCSPSFPECRRRSSSVAIALILRRDLLKKSTGLLNACHFLIGIFRPKTIFQCTARSAALRRGHAGLHNLRSQPHQKWWGPRSFTNACFRPRALPGPAVADRTHLARCPCCFWSGARPYPGSARIPLVVHPPSCTLGRRIFRTPDPSQSTVLKKL